MFTTHLSHPDSPRTLKQRLEDIREALDRLQRYTNGLNQEMLTKNQLVQDAIARQLTILAEAVKHVPREFRVGNAQVDWQRLQGLKGKLLIGIHRALAVDKACQVIDADVPTWKKQIAEIIANQV